MNALSFWLMVFLALRRQYLSMPFLICRMARKRISRGMDWSRKTDWWAQALGQLETWHEAQTKAYLQRGKVVLLRLPGGELLSSGLSPAVVHGRGSFQRPAEFLQAERRRLPGHLNGEAHVVGDGRSMNGRPQVWRVRVVRAASRGRRDAGGKRDEGNFISC